MARKPSDFDHLFGGKGSAEKTLAGMKRTYGSEDGAHVFWAKVAKSKRKGGGKRSLAQRLLG